MQKMLGDRVRVTQALWVKDRYVMQLAMKDETVKSPKCGYRGYAAFSSNLGQDAA
jgi:hypothetical protein